MSHDQIEKEVLNAGIDAYEEATGNRLPDADGEDAKIVAAIYTAMSNVEDRLFTAAPPEHEKAVDDAIGLVKIEFRMHKEDAKELDFLAKHRGIPLAVLIRRTLTGLLAR